MRGTCANLQISYGSLRAPGWFAANDHRSRRSSGSSKSAIVTVARTRRNTSGSADRNSAKGEREAKPAQCDFVAIRNGQAIDSQGLATFSIRNVSRLDVGCAMDRGMALADGKPWINGPNGTPKKRTRGATTNPLESRAGSKTKLRSMGSQPAPRDYGFDGYPGRALSIGENGTEWSSLPQLRRRS